MHGSVRQLWRFLSRYERFVEVLYGSLGSTRRSTVRLGRLGSFGWFRRRGVRSGILWQSWQVRVRFVESGSGGVR